MNAVRLVLVASILAVGSASAPAAMFPFQLHDAARTGDLDKVDKLLRKKWDPNRVFAGMTPIHSAAQGGSVAAAERLLAAGAAPAGCARSPP